MTAPPEDTPVLVPEDGLHCSNSRRFYGSPGGSGAGDENGLKTRLAKRRSRIVPNEVTKNDNSPPDQVFSCFPGWTFLILDNMPRPEALFVLRANRHRSVIDIAVNAPYHLFHIPVMGTGTFDRHPMPSSSLRRVASVMSIVDDLLCERVRKHYAQKEGIAYDQIPRYAETAGRAGLPRNLEPRTRDRPPSTSKRSRLCLSSSQMTKRSISRCCRIPACQGRIPRIAFHGPWP